MSERARRIPIVLKYPTAVMAGLVPAIHALLAKRYQQKAMPATSAGMTAES